MAEDGMEQLAAFDAIFLVRLYKNKPNEVVIQNGVFSRVGCELVIRYAYELAKSENKTLTSISKDEVGNEVIRKLRLHI